MTESDRAKWQCNGNWNFHSVFPMAYVILEWQWVHKLPLFLSGWRLHTGVLHCLACTKQHRVQGHVSKKVTQRVFIWRWDWD
jgi:hypothetical protein